MTNASLLVACAWPNRREWFERVLSEVGYQLYFAETALEAVRVAAAEDIRCVIAHPSVMFGGIDGLLTWLAELPEAKRQIPVVITGMPHMVCAALTHQVTGREVRCLEEPNLAELRIAVSELLDRPSPPPTEHGKPSGAK